MDKKTVELEKIKVAYYELVKSLGVNDIEILNQTFRY